MKYYKQNTEVFAYEDDGSQDDLIGDKVLIICEKKLRHTLIQFQQKHSYLKLNKEKLQNYLNLNWLD